MSGTLTAAPPPPAAEELTRPRPGARIGPQALVWACAGAYAAGFAALSLLRQRAFVTGRFDLGNMTQAVWSTAHGHPLAVTDLHGDQIVRLAAHVDPILALLAPLWWLWPSPDMLLTVQAAAVALGALPVFWLARKHLGSPRAGAGFALVYLTYPSTQWLTLNEFHPVALATPLLLYAFWYLDEDRLAAFAPFAVLAAASKEEIPLALAGMGIWYAVAHRRFRAGAAIALLGVAWTAVAIEVVIPHFNHGASSFYARYDQAGGSPVGLAHKAVSDPLGLAQLAFTSHDLHYLAQVLVPFGGLFLLAPLAALAAVPELAINLLSTVHTQTSIHFHYTAGEIAPLVVASVLGAARLARGGRRRAGAISAAALLLMVAANYRLGAIPFWRELPGGQSFQAYQTYVSPHDKIAERALRLIPDGAVVSASNSLGAHLSARRRILSFPIVDDATWVAYDETQPSYLDRFDPLPATFEAVFLRTEPGWRLVFEQDGVLVFHRDSATRSES